ncbi:MAG: DUF4160 domain-containing protein, partial [Erysipelotrichaceae bacterium]|nr:DUF4160 domain-containing protein [Erysipelotrichaceae bacterium]
MYFQQAEHNPPHVHALYGEDMAAVEIKTGMILEGYLPPKALALVREWIGLNRDDLLQMWQMQKFRPLPP